MEIIQNLNRFSFRITENPLFSKECFTELRAMAYRLTVCFENMNKHNTEEVTPHYHGYIECDGLKKKDTIYTQINRILKRYTQVPKTQKSIKQVNPKEEKKTMAYITKHGNYEMDYNSSYDYDSLQLWYKKEKLKLEEEKLKESKLFKDKLVEEYDLPIKSSLDQIKYWVACRLMKDGLLPVVSKVRSYSMYILYKRKIEIPMDDIYKML